MSPQPSAAAPIAPEDFATLDLSVAELDALPVGVITLDRRGNVRRYNRTEAVYARRSSDATLHKNFFRDIAPCTRVREFQGRFEAFAGVNDNGFERFDFTFPFRWGYRDVEILFVRRRDIEPIDIIVTTRHRPILDIESDLQPADLAARRAASEPVRLQLQDAVWHDDLTTGKAHWSSNCYRLCDLDPASPPPLGGLRAFAHSEEAAQLDEFARATLESRTACAFEHRIVTAAGHERYVAVTTAATYDSTGRAIAIDGRASDITARRAHERDLYRKANFDRLTGIANRANLESRLEAALENTANIGRAIAVLYIDLDRFKVINDTFGHVVGDDVLRAVARRLEACIRPEDFVARLSGDEFVILVSGLEGNTIVDAICERVTASFVAPITIDGRALTVSASIGISLAPHHGTTVDELLHAADSAMYECKASSHGAIVHFSDALRSSRRDRARLEDEILRALEDGALELHYQPIVDSHSHIVTSAEALLRWNHPERGLVMPDEFIGVVEANGAILAIGAWVLDTACARIRMSIDECGLAPTIAINVSLVQFRSPTLVELVRTSLEKYAVPPEKLVIELTESVASGNFYETMRTLAALKTLGVRLAIDDFGTGYSSLAYLKHFPIDVIKLDRAFVADIVNDPIDRAIAETVVALARHLHLQVVAEGVETEQQAHAMMDLGCDRLQGYYFGRAVGESTFFAADVVATP
ncbi:MAG: hypothetical protein NVS1B2_03620 [Vulcanimicrobiaceae bacterium]